MTRTTQRASSSRCRWLALAGLLIAAAAASLGTRSARADGPALCPADRPCITELFVTTGGDLFARWSGDYDAYNIRWEGADRSVLALDVGRAHTHAFERAARNVTYRFSVQGCNRRFLAPSACSPWAAREITDLFRPPQLRSATAVSPGTVRLGWRALDRAGLQGFRLTAYPQGEKGTRAQRVINVPARTEANGIAGYDLDGLTPDRTYCFEVEAETWNRDPEAVTSYFSAPSNTLCAVARPPAAVPTPKPYVADLTVVRISPQQGLGNEVAQGKYAIFIVEVRNNGAREADPVRVTLRFGGAISGSISGANTPGNFVCTGEGAEIRCSGTLASIETPITASGAFAVWVKGERTGTGTIAVSINDDRPLAESDYANNSRTLDVAVK